MENSDCRRQWFFPSHLGLSQPPPCEKRPSNLNPHYLMSTTREPTVQLCSQLCCPSSLGHNRWKSMSSVTAVSLQGQIMGCREWLSHDIFQVMNPALGNLKTVDGSCEGRYEWLTRHKSTSVCLFNARGFDKTPQELAQGLQHCSFKLQQAPWQICCIRVWGG